MEGANFPQRKISHFPFPGVSPFSLRNVNNTIHSGLASLFPVAMCWNQHQSSAGNEAGQSGC